MGEFVYLLFSVFTGCLHYFITSLLPPMVTFEAFLPSSYRDTGIVLGLIRRIFSS